MFTLISRHTERRSREPNAAGAGGFGFRIVLVYLGAAVLWLAAPGASAADVEGPEAALNDVKAAFRKLINESEQTRSCSMRTVLSRRFDVAAAAKTIFAPWWNGFTNLQQNELSEALVPYLSTTFGRTLNAFKDATIQDDNQTIVRDGNKAFVKWELQMPMLPATAMPKRGSTSIIVRVHKPQDHWLVYRVDMPGGNLVTRLKVQLDAVTRPERLGDKSAFEVLVQQLRAGTAPCST